MKYLLVLMILLGVIALIAFRYRKQLTAAWQVWKIFRQMTKPKSTEKNISVPAKAEMMRQCSGCKKFFPSNEGIKVGGLIYCSSNCLEKKIAN